MPAPEQPWPVGVANGAVGFRLMLHAVLDAQGQLWSTHEYAGPVDEQACLSLPQGGAPHASHVLMTEAIRRELFVSLLIKLSAEPELQAQLGDEDARETLESLITEATETVITNLLKREGKALAKEAVARVMRRPSPDTVA